MSDLKLEIGEAQIQNAIAVAIAQSFTGEKRDSLLRDIIRAHLSVKETSYDKETLLGKRVGQLIRNLAMKAVEDEVERARPAIEKTVHDVLGPGFAESVCAQLKAGMASRKVEGINVSIKMEDVND